MSILIKDVKAPQSCASCKMPMEICSLWVGTEPGIKHQDCPIVELPGKHGRLIDEKEAIKSTWMVLKGLGYYGLGNKGLTETVKAVFKTAPAIIEAEPPREET